MIKQVFILIILTAELLNADNTGFKDLKTLFAKHEYSKVCIKSGELYQQYKSNEEFLNIFGASCLKSDMINRLVLSIIKLYKTKEARENAAYFSTILYQKKLLYHALCDEIDISYINLPQTDYILSIIFDKFVRGEYDLKNGSYWFNDDKRNNVTYKLSLEERNGIKKMYLRTYKNNKITKVRIYW